VSLLHRLSHRELEVARLYGQGRQYKEIGLALNISPATVRNFLARIYTKLGIDNKVDLISLLSNE
jgi:DNA-binding CsgD family transcriptional regulator